MWMCERMDFLLGVYRDRGHRGQPFRSAFSSNGIELKLGLSDGRPVLGRIWAKVDSDLNRGGQLVDWSEVWPREEVYLVSGGLVRRVLAMDYLKSSILGPDLFALWPFIAFWESVERAHDPARWKHPFLLIQFVSTRDSHVDALVYLLLGLNFLLGQTDSGSHSCPLFIRDHLRETRMSSEIGLGGRSSLRHGTDLLGVQTGLMYGQFGEWGSRWGTRDHMIPPCDHDKHPLNDALLVIFLQELTLNELFFPYLEFIALNLLGRVRLDPDFSFGVALHLLGSSVVGKYLVELPLVVFIITFLGGQDWVLCHRGARTSLEAGVDEVQQSSQPANGSPGREPFSQAETWPIQPIAQSSRSRLVSLASRINKRNSERLRVFGIHIFPRPLSSFSLVFLSSAHGGARLGTEKPKVTRGDRLEHQRTPVDLILGVLAIRGGSSPSAIAIAMEDGITESRPSIAPGNAFKTTKRTHYQIGAVAGDTSSFVFSCAKNSTNPLYIFDPEIELTLRRLQKIRNTTVNISSSINSVINSDQFGTDHFIASTNIFTEPGQMENHDRTLKELATPDVVYQPWCIQYPQLELAQTYELKSGLIHLLPKFHGLAGEDPHKHLKEFHVVCSMMRP
ncbi:hypothetical protein CR513_47312, partial [Mucuna pruriens]